MVATTARTNGRPIGNERTAPQVVVTAIDDEGKLLKASNSQQWYKKVRAMRRHPTIALARALSVAPVLASTWSVESTDKAPEGAVDLIKQIMLPLRSMFLRTCFNGNMDFGWMAYEKILELHDSGEFSGLVSLKKLKPLLHDITDILVDKKTGAFVGVVQEQSGNFDSPDAVYLDVSETLLVSQNVEGTYWYGEPTSWCAEQAYDDWGVISRAAERYDRKIAGSRIVVHHPLGRTPVGGVDVDNDTIANNLINSLQSACGIKIPERRSDVPDDADRDAKSEPAWKIELLSDTANTQTAFVERQKYLDALMVRGYGLPERSVLEGTFGTKAEAEAHGDFAISLMEQRHEDVLQIGNWHLVNHILRVNWGQEAENTVYLKASPLADAQRAQIKAIYQAVLQNPEGFMLELSRMDLDAVRAKLGVPTVAEEEPERDEPDIDQGAALNGAQIAALLQITAQVSAGTLTPDAAAALMEAAFPQLDQEVIDRIVSALEAQPEPEPVVLPAVEEDAPAFT